MHSRNIAMYAIKELSGLSIEAQRAYVEKFLGHPLVWEMLPLYFTNLDTVKHQQHVMVVIKSSTITHCVGSRKADIVVALDIVVTLAASQSI